MGGLVNLAQGVMCEEHGPLRLKHPRGVVISAVRSCVVIFVAYQDRVAHVGDVIADGLDNFSILFELGPDFK